MSLNPFRADPGIAARHAEASRRLGARIVEAVEAQTAVRRRRPEDNLGGVVRAAEAAALIEEHGLEGIEALMLLALPAAQKLAQPPISGFFVGAVGLERETGNLILGGNLEFPGTHLGFTVHGEGFVFTRAASRGTSIATIAIGEAHPCAHCRQYLSEFATSGDLVLIDPLGHRLTMRDLYPWPFDPAYLGEDGARPGVANPALALASNDLHRDLAAQLTAAGRRSHAPYSRCPGAVVLSLADGGRVVGSAVESVAFNPTMGPLQAALIDLVAHGYGPADITAGALGTSIGGDVDYSRSTAELLGRLAPAVHLTVVGWA